MEITKGMPEDRQDIINLGNLVFSEEFEKLLPKLFGTDKDMSRDHYLVKEQNEIRAMVGSFPLALKVMNKELKVRGIGIVSVHPLARGKGYMKELMKEAVRDMEQEKIDLAILSGQRQRYEYFGFTPAGSQIVFYINQANLKHKKVMPKEELRKLETVDEQTLNTLYRLHRAEKLHGIRLKEDFIDICKSWKNELYGIYRSGILIGYLILSPDKISIHEIYLEDYKDFATTLKTVLDTFKKEETKVILGTHRIEEINQLAGYCESYQIQCNTFINIFNYKTVIQSFLELKKSYDILEKGELVLEIVDKTKLRICIDERIEVEETCSKADVTLSHLEAISFLTSPLRQFKTSELNKNRLISSWFPLPFFFSSVDNV